MHSRSRIGLTLIACCAIALTGGGALYRSLFAPVLTKKSPNGRHTAKLWRYQAIDVNYYLAVNGDDVYRSADFAPVDADFREQLYWNVEGDSVVLEIADTRLFGYNASERRMLSAQELDEFRATPFAELRFEGALPGPNGE